MSIRDKFDPSTHVLEDGSRDKYIFSFVDDVIYVEGHVSPAHFKVKNDGLCISIKGLRGDLKLIPKPQEPINLPENIDMRWQWAAMFNDNGWVVYEEQPVLKDIGWMSDFPTIDITDLFTISANIPWDKSLHKRNKNRTWSRCDEHL